MLNLAPLRRLLVPTLLLLIIVAFYRSEIRFPRIATINLSPDTDGPKSIHTPINLHKVLPLPIHNTSDNYLSPPIHYFYEQERSSSGNGSSAWDSVLGNTAYKHLFYCSRKANKFTGHVRLPNIVQNVSQVAPGTEADSRVFWNPTIISLPWWSKNQYLMVSRIVTDGHYQENVLCEANVCYAGSSTNGRAGEQACSEDDLHETGPAGGLRCATPLISLSVPPTPARRCEGKFTTYADIPGFHDPRVFWSGRGEPLMMVNTQSRYACFGLWVIDLRSLYPALHELLSSPPDRFTLGPLKSYSTLTELTRNPAADRGQIEKNWMIFYTASGESYIHYDLSDTKGGPRGRTFAKLLGNGLSTPNLTDPLESPCLQELGENEPDMAKRGGRWHQATNSLRVILCDRSEKGCAPTPTNQVFVSLVHRKFANYLKLPLRYERYFIVWEARPPFHMLGVSKYPVLMANETASGWTAEQNWDDWPLPTPPSAIEGDGHKLRESRRKRDIEPGFAAAHNASSAVAPDTTSNATSVIGRDFWAYFTYTVSISWAWSGEKVEAEMKNVGYLDDEVLLSIGIDDKGQGFSRVKAGDLMECMRACPAPRLAEDARD